eukprot:CAMPEP_0113561584 /NCGR_PEP_ID=MMETSP0015_2-20120614/20056_1 /TAXON_ID=2838 /ORGANISM="Odontella" /LENGTH=844 /DNA_ID=CAMNT_0000463393 /DNA_START=37 /DNA_END=2571 /DNA_ORIENTATION=+ /assembly_acc=CAM_ASM_000160
MAATTATAFRSILLASLSTAVPSSRAFSVIPRIRSPPVGSITAASASASSFFFRSPPADGARPSSSSSSTFGAASSSASFSVAESAGASSPSSATALQMSYSDNGASIAASADADDDDDDDDKTTADKKEKKKKKKMDVPYGAWKSPITSKAITAGSVALGSLRVVVASRDNAENSSSSSSLYWLEGRPREGGRYVLCRYSPDDPDRSERDAVDATPAGSNARTRVHEYGGGGVSFGDDGGDDGDGDGSIFYSDFDTQRLMKLNEGSDDEPPEALTPDDDHRYRFADGRAVGETLYAVREDHADPAPGGARNDIAAVNVDDGTMETVAAGNDFYGAPRPSPDGTKLAYVTWNHPNMPWDATELRVVDIIGGDGEGSSSSAGNESEDHALIAGTDGDTSVLQPLWHPLTGDLYYISDESGYYNIYRARRMDSSGSNSDEEAPPPVNVLPMEFDFGGSSPGWSLGEQGFDFLDDGRIVAAYNRDGATRLVVADVVNDGDGTATDVTEYSGDDGLPMQFDGVVPAGGGNDVDDVYFVGGSPRSPTSVYKWNLSTGGPAVALACSSSLKFDESVISEPRPVEFPTVLGTAYGYYYPPRNDAYESSSESAPPLLVKAHGGPTSCAGTSFNAAVQYWTSRGFAVLDVDYGGSTGYGREYRRRLRGSWGVVDIDDVCAGAQYLVDQGLADGDRLCIDGGSAGGYTTLGALAFRDVFTAGCSLYGIGDLTALAGDTHKFESRYLDGLVGPYPETEELYRRRSPIESVDALSCPILLLQGAEDRVVPPNQAEMMHDALKEKGIPTCLKMYEKEQHGFRIAENIEDALDSELAFFGRVFGIDVPDAVELDIVNM